MQMQAMVFPFYRGNKESKRQRLWISILNIPRQKAYEALEILNMVEG